MFVGVPTGAPTVGCVNVGVIPSMLLRPLMRPPVGVENGLDV